MTRIEKLNQVQDLAVKALEENNFRGTVLMAPGTGKGFTSFKAIYRMLELGLINLGDTVVYLAETIVREKTFLEDELPKFKTIYNKDFLADFDFKFHCYQSKPDKIYDDFKDVAVVIMDEVQDAISEQYHTTLTNNKCPYVISLTGAMSMEANVFPSKIPEGMLNTVAQSDIATKEKKITDFITKGQILEIHCSVIFSYSTSQAISDGVISQFKSYLIEHTLDNQNKAIQTWKSYNTLGTEYDFYMKRKARVSDFRTQKYLKAKFSREMCQMLYELPSKINLTRAILHRLKGQKTLIFGIRKAALAKITPNVVEPHNYKELIDKFNVGEITEIASVKMLKQGITLEGVENIIFHSYDSKWHNNEQKRARIRWIDGRQAKLFYIVTKDTYEEKWFTNLKKQKNSKGEIIQLHDLNIEAKIDSKVLIDWYKSLKQ